MLLSDADAVPPTNGNVIDFRIEQPASASVPIVSTLDGIVKAESDVHKTNAPSPIDVTLDGLVMFSRFGQTANALFPISVTLDGIVAVLSFVQFANDLSPIVFIILGNQLKFVRFVFVARLIVFAVSVEPCAVWVSAVPSNAFSPIDVTLAGMLMLESAKQPLNAQSPIDVTLSGIVMFESDVQLSNA